MKKIFLTLIILCLTYPNLGKSQNQEIVDIDDINSLGTPNIKPRLMLILDSSGSMNEKDRYGDIKLDSAKITLSKILDKIPDDETNVALMAYDNCDTKLLVPPSNTNMGRVKSRAMSIYPTAKTPIAKSIREAGQILSNNSQETTIILISDGEETCGGDPCLEADRLRQRTDVNVKFYVIGYSVDESTQRQLQCIADNKDRYFDIDDSFSLETTVHKIVKEEVTKKFDEDTDGVKNEQDKCPKTLPAFSVNKTGCEIAYTMPTPFKTNEATIPPALVEPAVDQLVDY
ncbi:von Willebrand factor type A, partial [Candidatus Thiomargarita nelsonii]